MAKNFTNVKAGAETIIKTWLHLRPKERLLIVSSDQYLKEAQILKAVGMKQRGRVDLMIVEKKGKKVGVFFDENENIFKGYQAIIGASDYSIVTTKAAKKAIASGSKFLSLPLLTNDNRSLLEYPFLQMDTKKSKMMAHVIMGYLQGASEVRVTTQAGSDLKFYKRGRKPGFFNGVVKDGKGFSSASIEVYVPIEETKTEGIMVVDGSFGYIGKAKEPVKLIFKEGKIIEIEDNQEGRRLKAYIEDYKDPLMYSAAELGIGLNSLAKCAGNSYIEDESAYGTFHIGFGRNIALGGIQEANGHFDVVAKRPDIYADNRMIMQQGKIIVPEPQVY
ncbi:MAG TPA: peptidase [Candidatus Dorea intestinavium]|nr:peptidase [Candidatus Dorea intestinavium]